MLKKALLVCMAVLIPALSVASAGSRDYGDRKTVTTDSSLDYGDR